MATTQPPTTAPEFVGVNEAASMLGIGARSVWGLLSTGEMRRCRIGRRTVIPREDIQKFADRVRAGAGGGR